MLIKASEGVFYEKNILWSLILSLLIVLPIFTQDPLIGFTDDVRRFFTKLAKPFEGVRLAKQINGQLNQR